MRERLSDSSSGHGPRCPKIKTCELPSRETFESLILGTRGGGGGGTRGLSPPTTERGKALAVPLFREDLRSARRRGITSTLETRRVVGQNLTNPSLAAGSGAVPPRHPGNFPFFLHTLDWVSAQKRLQRFFSPRSLAADTKKEVTQIYKLGFR